MSRRCCTFIASAFAAGYLSLAAVLTPVEGTLLARWRQVNANGGALKGIDLEVRTGRIIVAVGSSGAGKSTLLKLLAEGHPESAEVFEMAPCLPRPLEVLVGSMVTDTSPQVLSFEEEADLRRVWSTEPSACSRSKTARWKARCLQSLSAQQARARAQMSQVYDDRPASLLLLDEVLDLMPRPLRLRFASELQAAVGKAGSFGVVMATHCLGGDISWLMDVCDEAWILEQGQLRQTLRLKEKSARAELTAYAALRSRIGTVNS